MTCELCNKEMVFHPCEWCDNVHPETCDDCQGCGGWWECPRCEPEV
jgi:hypothetical protein